MWLQIVQNVLEQICSAYFVFQKKWYPKRDAKGIDNYWNAKKSKKRQFCRASKIMFWSNVRYQLITIFPFIFQKKYIYIYIYLKVRSIAVFCANFQDFIKHWLISLQLLLLSDVLLSPFQTYFEQFFLYNFSIYWPIGG